MTVMNEPIHDKSVPVFFDQSGLNPKVPKAFFNVLGITFFVIPSLWLITTLAINHHTENVNDQERQAVMELIQEHIRNHNEKAR